MNASDSIVIIPTYNEKENIEKIIRAVFGLENGWNSESHCACTDGRVVTDEGKAKARMLILGDWINHFTYAVYDGDNLLMLQYIAGERRT